MIECKCGGKGFYHREGKFVRCICNDLTYIKNQIAKFPKEVVPEKPHDFCISPGWYVVSLSPSKFGQLLGHWIVYYNTFHDIEYHLAVEVMEEFFNQFLNEYEGKR